MGDGLARLRFATVEDAAPVFRYERLREIVGTDLTLERELLRAFLDDSIRRMADLRSAILDRSAGRVAAEAHSLMGACRTLGADSLAVYCEQLERAADHLSIEPVIGVLAGLRREDDQLRATIGMFLNAIGDPAASPTGQPRDLAP